MKKANINLLPTINRFETSRIRWAKQFKSVAFIVVIAWTGIMAVTFGLKIYFSIQKNKISKEIAQVDAGIKELAPQALLQQALRLRIKTAAELIENRNPVLDSFETFRKILPEGTKLESISIGQGKISAGLRMPSLEELREFEDNVEAIKGEEIYRDLKVGTVSQQKGEWAISLEITEFDLTKK